MTWSAIPKSRQRCVTSLSISSKVDALAGRQFAGRALPLKALFPASQLGLPLELVEPGPGRCEGTRIARVHYQSRGPLAPLLAARLRGPFAPRRSRLIVVAGPQHPLHADTGPAPLIVVSLRLIEKLHPVERGIDAVQRQQIIVAADLRDAAALEDDDRVGPHDRR
jgi:hypothetical protein